MQQVTISYEELRAMLDNLPNPNEARWLDFVRLFEAAEDLGIKALLEACRSEKNGNIFPYIEISSQLDWKEPESRRRVLACLLHYIGINESILRGMALSILGTILQRYPDKTLQRGLLGLLYDEDVLFRQSVVLMYEALRDEQAVPYLVTLLDDLDNSIRYMSNRALLTINSPSAQYALAEWEKRQSTTP